MFLIAALQGSAAPVCSLLFILSLLVTISKAKNKNKKDGIFVIFPNSLKVLYKV